MFKKDERVLTQPRAVLGINIMAWVLVMLWAVFATVWAAMSDYDWWLMKVRLDASTSINEQQFQLWQQEYQLKQQQLQPKQPEGSFDGDELPAHVAAQQPSDNQGNQPLGSAHALSSTPTRTATCPYARDTTCLRCHPYALMPNDPELSHGHREPASELKQNDENSNP